MANKKLAMFLMLLVGAAAPAQDANNTSSQPGSNSTLSLGPGVIVTTRPYKGVETSVYPIPFAMFVSGRFYISGATAGYRLLADQGWTLDAIGKWRFDGYDSDDSDELDGMHDRNMTVDVGGEFSLLGEWGEAWLSTVTDALGRHDGQEIKLGYTKPFNFEKLTLSPSAGMIWQSSNLANYYYGVGGDEARPGRPRYSVGDAINWFAGIKAQYHADERWSFFAGVVYQWLDSKIHDSPIVSDSYTISIIAGAMYKF